MHCIGTFGSRMNALGCVLAIFTANVLITEAVHIIWDNNAIYDPEATEEIGRSDEARMPNWFLIYPGMRIEIFFVHRN